MRAWLSLRLNSERKGAPKNKVDSVHTSCGLSIEACPRENKTYPQAQTCFVLLTEIRHIGRLSDMKNSKGTPYDARYGG